MTDQKESATCLKMQALVQFLDLELTREIQDLEKKFGSKVADQAVTHLSNAISFAMKMYRNPEQETFLVYHDGKFEQMPKNTNCQ